MGLRSGNGFAITQWPVLAITGHRLTLKLERKAQMPKAKKSQNRHPVDRLYDIREQIKLLQAEEKTLRDDIIDSGDTKGDQYVAMIKSSTRNLLDRPALEKRFGRDAVAECTKASEVTTLSLYKKAEQVDVFS
jgi:hypothetical protein